MATEAVEAIGRTVARSAARAAERYPDRVAIRHQAGEPTPKRNVVSDRYADLFDAMYR